MSLSCISEIIFLHLTIKDRRLNIIHVYLRVKQLVMTIYNTKNEGTISLCERKQWRDCSYRTKEKANVCIYI